MSSEPATYDARGLVAAIVQNYYGLVAAQRKLASGQQSLREAQQFLDITRKQEAGGEVAHSDVVKAQTIACCFVASCNGPLLTWLSQNKKPPMSESRRR